MQVSKRVPTLFTRLIGSEQVAVRFAQIGNKARFNIILGRFRDEFPLTKCQELDSQPWWLILQSQRSELVEFCRRNGLSLKEE